MLSATTTPSSWQVLGNTRVRFADKDNDGVIDVTNNSNTNEILEESHYYPFGLSFNGPWMYGGGQDYRYKFGGKELNEDFSLGLYDYGARWYDPAIARWTASDPLAEKAPGWTPYRYGFNNPMRMTDPTGMEEKTYSNGYSDISATAAIEVWQDSRGEPNSTIVEKAGNGTYKVVGVKDDGDAGIYLENGEKVGESLTPYSFTLDDGKTAVEGAVIDFCSTEAQNFLDELFSDFPSVLEYMRTAKEYQLYDIKTRGMDKSLSDEDKIRFKYRGSVLANGKIASARDAGNIGAGWISGINGIPWWQHRIAANSLETKQKTGSYLGTTVLPSTPPSDPYTGYLVRYREGIPTVSAQKIGYNIGASQYALQLFGLGPKGIFRD